MLHGWGLKPPAKVPWWKKRPLLQVVFALPFAETVLNAGHASISAVVLLVIMGAVLTGHASLVDLGSVKLGAINSPAEGQADERYSRWIPDEGYWHDFTGLMVSGLLISAPCGIALVSLGHWHTGLAIVASGALKSLGYAIPRFIWGPGHTAGGEILTGAILWGPAIALALYYGEFIRLPA